jgi:membrane protein
MHKPVTREKLQKFGKILGCYLLRRVRETMILRVAASLGYTTLIAVVPLIAVALAVFAAFPSFESVRNQVQDFFIENLVPDIGQDIQNYMTQFVSAASKLTTLGVAGIAVTAVLLLSTIENSFNFIFNVRRHRNFATKITVYWTIITLCPLLLGIAFSLKGYLFTLKYFQSDYFVGSGIIVSYILPNLLTFGALILSYTLVPNKKVRISDAFWGAVVAFLLLALLRCGFGYFLLLNVAYRTLYGALATLPVLLIWLYLWWTVVLFGAIFTATLEDFRKKRRLWL